MSYDQHTAPIPTSPQPNDFTRPLMQGEPSDPVANLAWQREQESAARRQQQEQAIAATQQRLADLQRLEQTMRAAAQAVAQQTPPQPASVVDAVLSEMSLQPGAAQAILGALHQAYGALPLEVARVLIQRDLSAPRVAAAVLQPLPPPQGPPPGSVEFFAADPEVQARHATFGLTPLPPGQVAQLPRLPGWSSTPNQWQSDPVPPGTLGALAQAVPRPPEAVPTQEQLAASLANAYIDCVAPYRR